VNPKDQNRTNNKDAQQLDPNELNQLKHLLHQSIPPFSADRLEPRADLWPQLRARINSQSELVRPANSNRESTPTQVRIPWFDWALAALAAAALIFFPGIIPALLYHF
jgi:hypothetical protein